LIRAREIISGLGLFLAAALFATATACADESDSPEEQGSASATQDNPYLRSPTPTATSVRDLAPQLGPGVRKIGGNRLSFSVGDGIDYAFDPYGFELAAGEERPPCEQFVFAFSWQVVVPQEPPADIGFVWRSGESGATSELGRGASGSGITGCGVLTAVNEAGRDVAVVVDYQIGRAGG
jgi:hypothetical protein